MLLLNSIAVWCKDDLLSRRCVQNVWLKKSPLQLNFDEEEENSDTSVAKMKKALWCSLWTVARYGGPRIGHKRNEAGPHNSAIINSRKLGTYGIVEDLEGHLLLLHLYGSTHHLCSVCKCIIGCYVCVDTWFFGEMGKANKRPCAEVNGLMWRHWDWMISSVLSMQSFLRVNTSCRVRQGQLIEMLIRRHQEAMPKLVIVTYKS